MIIRLIAVDPRPAPGKSDVLVYQVPENSSEMRLLTELLSDAKIEWTVLTPQAKNGGLK